MLPRRGWLRNWHTRSCLSGQGRRGPATSFQSRVGRRGNLTGSLFFAEERVVNQRRATVGHVGVDGKLGVSHVLSSVPSVVRVLCCPQ